MEIAAAQQLEHLYQEYHEALRDYLRTKVSDFGLADDLVQDTFLKLYAFVNQGKEVRNPKAWLFRVAQNMLIDHFRKNKHGSSELNFDLPSGDTPHGHGPEDCLIGIIASLPYKYKKAVYLVDVKGERQVDAAVKVGVSLPTFKSHVQRGRKLVKQGYVDCCNYEIDEDGHLQGEAKEWSDCAVCSQG